MKKGSKKRKKKQLKSSYTFRSCIPTCTIFFVLNGHMSDLFNVEIKRAVCENDS